jgi:ubiquinone/menaquinone biosynthesis C-methylase UbiE
MPNYGDPKYWDERYSEQEGSTFDWLENYTALKTYLEPMLPGPEALILVLGCGNAEFSENMYDDGYHNIVNIDISQVVIDQMQARNSTREGMSFLLMDVRKLEFPDNTFDLAIDKSTIDALLCGEQSFLNVALMTREVQRVLKVGGYYAAISYGVPENRSAHFTWDHLNWEYRHESVGGNDSDSRHFIYVCRKREGWLEADGKWADVEAQLFESEED